MEAKALARRRVIIARGRRTPAERADAEARLADLGVPAWRGLKVVAAHAAVGTEPPTRAMLDGLAAASVVVWLPVVDGDRIGPDNRLEWAPYDGWDRLVAGPFGLLQPAGPRLGPDAPARAELVVVPAMAVNPAGHRLGRGGGYYDRALAGVDVPMVAVVFDDERVDAVPVEPHDIAVDAVLSPSALTPAGRPGVRAVPGLPTPGGSVSGSPRGR
jgi:5-formyltetrahydrofolate cyclo-ligase